MPTLADNTGRTILSASVVPSIPVLPWAQWSRTLPTLLALPVPQGSSKAPAPQRFAPFKHCLSFITVVPTPAPLTVSPSCVWSRRRVAEPLG